MRDLQQGRGLAMGISTRRPFTRVPPSHQDPFVAVCRQSLDALAISGTIKRKACCRAWIRRLHRTYLRRCCVPPSPPGLTHTQSHDDNWPSAHQHGLVEKDSAQQAHNTLLSSLSPRHSLARLRYSPLLTSQCITDSLPPSIGLPSGVLSLLDGCPR